ncbi:MAG TPA: alpha/beta hydrolase [Syntrophales bacterium]|nr:alpha/beta hydrolase [Syntrophales bacterium]
MSGLVEKRHLSTRNFYVRAASHRLFAQFIQPDSEYTKKTPSTLVFLHEGLGGIDQWRDFPACLSSITGLPALIYERWGYGSSDTLDTPRTSRYLHDEALISLPEVLEHVHISDAVLIGHSDGGSIALIFSAIHGDKVRGVITEAAHVFVEDVTITGIRQAVELYETTDLKNRLRKFHKDNTDSMFRAWADTWLAPWFRDWNIEEYLSRISCPLLVIQGEDDEYGTRAQVESIVSQVAGPVEGLILPNCGHVPHNQARERVLKEMARFIGSLVHSDEI